jgi:hemin uptake protein HemP
MASNMTDSPPITDPLPEEPDESEQPTPGRESWRSEELLGERTEVQIVHGGEVYRLRRTRQGKLILCK